MLFNLFMSSSFPFKAAVYFISSVREYDEADEEDQSPPGFRESNSVRAPDSEDEEEPDVCPHGGETGDGKHTNIVHFLRLLSNCKD